MDELTVMRSFRAERVKQNPTARAAAWRALEDRFDVVPAAPAPIATPGWRRGPRLALAGAAVAAVVAAALIVNAGGTNTSAAYAVEPQPEGMVNVEIRSLEDAKGLEEALDQAGIPASVTYLATGMACKEPRFRPAPPPHGFIALFGRVGPSGNHVPTAFRISRDAVRPGQTLVITASPGPLADAVQAKVAEGSVAPCEPVMAPPNSEGTASGATGQDSRGGG